MYAALDEENNLIYAQQLQSPSGRYVCPKCQQPVIVKMSKKQKYYFAHLEACQLAGRAMKRQGESQQHQAVKTLLAQGYGGAQIEYWLDTIQQQVDVWYATEPPMILEFQKSKINEEILQKRHQAYRTVTPYVYWFGDNAEWQRSKLSKWQKQLLYYHHSYGYHGYAVDISMQEIIIYTHLPIIYCAESWHCCQTVISEMKQLPSVLTSSPLPNATKLHYRTKRDVQPNRLRQSLMQAELYFPFLNGLRKQGVTLYDLPEWVFAHTWECLLIATPTWQLFGLVWLYLYRQAPNDCITFEELKEQLNVLVEQQQIQLLSMPLVNKDKIDDLTQALIQCFAYFGHLERKEKNVWFVKHD
ncbi:MULTISPECIES: competence protein CoiA family protein [unclassified Facklamia]|uniref:competence protein CoiA family protein n=1 Tax=Aerococcaceae TaxID=186827 RepID=UPI0013B78EA8|nr:MULTISPECIES: competence protein CoiA family protein [unclassified Facklamia]MBS4461364.1 hypothetical protein [Aerococcaceae bacterium zg-B36]NEW64162.1 hypothetical protein [Facklamia sp. 252]NEW67619.1 hypothetical protein [Facklamia sp. 253]QQD65867.1 hypothetical protein JDW14_01725 [Aerococcaceae bacterium zg-252]